MTDDIAGLSERLRAAHPNSMQRTNGSDILLEAANALDALQARVKELEADVARIKIQRDHALLDLERISNECDELSSKGNPFAH